LSLNQQQQIGDIERLATVSLLSFCRKFNLPRGREIPKQYLNPDLLAGQVRLVMSSLEKFHLEGRPFTISHEVIQEKLSGHEKDQPFEYFDGKINHQQAAKIVLATDLLGQ
jgi:hypothetical protein